MAVSAIILAAGASRRLGRPKQLLQVDGETLLAHAIRVALEGGAEPVLVVLGAHAHAICASVAMEQVVAVLNPEWEKGMASSIRAGVRALLSCSPGAPGAAFLVCDQPRLTGAHMRALIERFHHSSQTAAVASAYRGTRGIPAVFPRALFSRLLSLKGDNGARGILADPGCAIVDVPFPGGEIDVDFPADLDRLNESDTLEG